MSSETPGSDGAATRKDITVLLKRIEDGERGALDQLMQLVHHDLWSSNARFGVADPANADFWLTRLPEFDD